MTDNKMTRNESKTAKKIIKLPAEQGHFYQKTWRNWFLLIGVLILTTIGLATAIPPLLSERIVNPWPWVKTDLVLLVGLSLMVLSFIGYMTQQQLHVMNLHKKLEHIQIEANHRINQHAERLYALTSISRIMSTETNIQNIFNAITKICAETFQADRASLMLFDNEKQDLVVKSVCGRSSEEILYMRQKAGEGISGWVAKNRESLLLNSPDVHEQYPDLKFNDMSINSAMVTPIIVRNELVGILNISSGSPGTKYERDDLRALQIFAENAGVCIRHTEHVEWMKKMLSQLKKKTKSSMIGES